MRNLLLVMLAVVVWVTGSNAVAWWQTRDQLRVHVRASERQVVVLGDLRVPDGTAVRYELAPAHSAAGKDSLQGVLVVMNESFALQHDLPAGGAWDLALNAASGERRWEHRETVKAE
jgi:hypothetical protein